MSRYLLLFLLNFPFVVAGLLGAVTQYKLKKSSKRRFTAQVVFWVTILVGLLTAQPFYEWLYDRQLTRTEPLSLFDVIQITAIVILFYMTNRIRTKSEETEHRLQHLHQQLSITQSLKDKK